MSEVTLNVAARDGTTRKIQAKTGEVLMHVLRDSVDVDVGICGGEISCGTCLVRLNREWFDALAPASEDERDMLEALQACDHARLACQVVLDETANGMQAALLHEE